MPSLDPQQVQHHLDRWVKDFLSVPQSEFASLPPCPYCRQAWLDQRVEVRCCQDWTDIGAHLLELPQTWQANWEVLIIATQPDWLGGCQLIDQVRQLNQWLAGHDLVALVDHPGNPQTTLSHVDTSNGTYLLVLVQQLRSLQAASAHLREKTSYYHHWADQDLDNIVHWRSQLV